MSKFIVLCMVLLSVGYRVHADDLVRLDLSLAYNRSVEQQHLLVGSLVSVPVGGFTFGAGIRGYLGIGHEGRYVAPYLRAEFFNAVTVGGADAANDQRLSASLYVGLGQVIVVRRPDEISDAGGGLMLLVGTQGPIAYAGPGVLSFDAGIELSPPPPFRGGTNTGDPALDGLLGFFRYFLADPRYRWKATLGLNYSILF